MKIIIKTVIKQKQRKTKGGTNQIWWPFALKKSGFLYTYIMEIWFHELLFPSIHPIYMSVYFLSRRNCLILKLQSESTEAGFHSEETWSILCSGLRNKAMGSKGNRPSHAVTFVFLLVNSILARKMVNCEEELPKPNRCQPTGYQQVTDSFLRQEVCCWIDRKRVLYWQMVSKTRKQKPTFSNSNPTRIEDPDEKGWFGLPSKYLNVKTVVFDI